VSLRQEQVGAYGAGKQGHTEVQNRVEWEIRPEQSDDASAVEALVAGVFGPGRYAKAAYRLREGVNPIYALSFVAIEKHTLRGSIRFWPIFVGPAPALLLGPLAVQPDQRGRGVGIGLMQRGILEAERLGYRTILLVGDLPYYGRVGFAPVPLGRMSFPGPVERGRLLGLRLQSGALEAVDGAVARGRIDHAVCASGAPLGAST